MRVCKRGHEMPPVGLCKPCAAIRSGEYHARRVASETPQEREARLAKRRIVGRRFTTNHPDRHRRRVEAMAPTDMEAFRQQRHEQYRRRKDADPDGHRARGRETARRQLETRRAEINARRRGDYAADPERHIEYQRGYARRNPEKMRDKGLRRFYGMTLSEYESMVAVRGGLCDICHQPETSTLRGKVKALSVDHDHDTEVVRGLLCSNCNRALGYFKDDPVRVAEAAAYLAVRKPIVRLVS